MSGISVLQAGQADLELAACDAAVLLAPYVGTTPILDLESGTGALDLTKIGSSSPYESVGNWTKDEGVTLTNKPTVNDIKSHGKGSPTRKLFSEAAKGITYTPQETKLINLQNSWGFPVSAVTVSTTGGVKINIPNLPYNIQWRAVLLAWDSFNGKDIFKWWVANKVSVGERQDMQMKDSNTDNLGVALSFEDPGGGVDPVIFGICGEGWVELNSMNNTGFALGTPLTGITATPGTVELDLSDAETQQITVTDSNLVNRTSQASYGTSDETVATVSAAGLITPHAVGTADITATYGGHTDVVAVTVIA
jgi:hypothetical protein